MTAWMRRDAKMGKKKDFGKIYSIGMPSLPSHPIVLMFKLKLRIGIAKIELFLFM